jgi:glycosyltransferase involved in cell wall biosynthesis
VRLIRPVPHERAVAEVRGARALIVPSQWYEGVALSLLEAFACAVPVIACRIGSLAEVIEDRLNGLLFEPAAASELSSVIRRLLEQPELASALGARGRESYVSTHTLEHNAAALTAVYRELTAAS